MASFIGFLAVLGRTPTHAQGFQRRDKIRGKT
jgi:hypothetical protein